MFVQNQIADLNNHKTVIANALAQSDEARFVVAYVKESGVNMILENMQNKSAKLLCSFDMGITQMSGIQKLLEHNVEVKVYKSNEGTFHPKVWLFKRAEKWQALIGSANLTQAALVSNVEASVFLDDDIITTNAVMFFNYLWNAPNSESVNRESIARLQEELAKRKLIKEQNASQKTIKSKDAHEYEATETAILFNFVKNWIDISKCQQKGISSLWRGWYIIPDQGYVDDKLVGNLAAYASFIGDGIKMHKSATDPNYLQLLEAFVAKSEFKRSRLKLTPHDLFVRQAKNYLIKFGWVYHPLAEKNGEYKPQKNILHLTPLGRLVAKSDNLSDVKKLYSEYFEDYTYNGLCLVKFTRNLLKRFGYLDLHEFDYFVTHAYNDDDMEIIAELISVYRLCKNKNALHREIMQYFKNTKEPTAKNVHGNYLKNVKHTMSAIAWCSGFYMSGSSVIKLTDNANQ